MHYFFNSILKTGMYKKVPYVRGGQQTTKSRLERQRWQCSLKEIFRATDVNIVRKLLKEKILFDKTGQPCPFCKPNKRGENGKLGPLRYVEHRSRPGLFHRCKRRGCQKYVLPHHDHPIFTTGSGSGASSLQDQAATLFSMVAGADPTTTARLVGHNQKMISGICRRLDQCRTLVVERDEKKIQFGAEMEWADVEGDEVDLGKRDTTPANFADNDEALEWEQWQGLVERGRRKTLVLSRTRPKKTKRRAPGPGPIKKSDWEPIAKKYLKNKKVLFHTDGAKAYRLKTTPLDGVLHDWVVHKKKRITVGGKTFWTKPKYVLLVQHKLPDGKVILSKSGTQIIDRVWSFIKKHVGKRNAQVGKASLRQRVRSAQWLYWHQGEDLWAATGVMLQSLQA